MCRQYGTLYIEYSYFRIKINEKYAMFYILAIHIFIKVCHVLKHNGFVKNSKIKN